MTALGWMHRFQRVGAIGAVAVGLGACATVDEFLPEISGSSESAAEPAATDELKARVRIADTMLKSGDAGNAADLYRKAHALHPEAPAPLVGIGRSMAALGAHADAVHSFHEALALAPGHPGALRGLGSSLVALNEAEEALATFDDLLALTPGDHRAHNGRGVALDLLNRHDEAQASYRKGLAIARDNVSLRNNLGLSLALSGNHEDAIALLTHVAASPGATAKTRQNLALALGLSGDEERAQKVAAVDLKPGQVADNLAYYANLRSRQSAADTAQAVTTAPTIEQTVSAEAPTVSVAEVPPPAAAEVDPAPSTRVSEEVDHPIVSAAAPAADRSDVAEPRKPAKRTARLHAPDPSTPLSRPSPAPEWGVADVEVPHVHDIVLPPERPQQLVDSRQPPRPVAKHVAMALPVDDPVKEGGERWLLLEDLERDPPPSTPSAPDNHPATARQESPLAPSRPKPPTPRLTEQNTQLIGEDEPSVTEQPRRLAVNLDQPALVRNGDRAGERSYLNLMLKVEPPQPGQVWVNQDLLNNLPQETVIVK